LNATSHCVLNFSPSWLGSGCFRILAKPRRRTMIEGGEGPVGAEQLQSGYKLGGDWSLLDSQQHNVLGTPIQIGPGVPRI